MTKYLKKCADCEKYSLENSQAKCPYCGGGQVNAFPPKFSLKDKYQRYRLEYFKEEFNKRFNRS
jgi:rRNA maturation protein Nop10